MNVPGLEALEAWARELGARRVSVDLDAGRVTLVAETGPQGVVGVPFRVGTEYQLPSSGGVDVCVLVPMGREVGRA